MRQNRTNAGVFTVLLTCGLVTQAFTQVKGLTFAADIRDSACLQYNSR